MHGSDEDDKDFVPSHHGGEGGGEVEGKLAHLTQRVVLLDTKSGTSHMVALPLEPVYA